MTAEQYASDKRRVEEASEVIQALKDLNDMLSHATNANHPKIWSFLKYSDGSTSYTPKLPASVVRQIFERILRREIADLKAHLEEL